MSKRSKQLSNPYSTGGGGAHFEAHVQASYVVLMLTGGYAPCLPCWPIKEIKLQGKIDGYDTDDLIVYVEEPASGERRRLLGQVKHSIRFTKGNTVFSEVIQAAWNDFNNPGVFEKGKDIIALITGPLSATDSTNVQWLLSQAKCTKDSDEFYRNVKAANFSPSKSLEKLKAFQHQLTLANNNTEVPQDDVYSFLNHFHLIGYDLGKETGVVLSLLHSHISQFSNQYPQSVWARVVDIVQTWNQNAGTITLDKLPDGLREVFKQVVITRIPSDLTVTQPVQPKKDWNQYQYATDLALANLIGAWDERNQADTDILDRITTENYSTWVLKARKVLQLSDSPLFLKNGHWQIKDRATLWDTLGSRIFDQHLDTFKSSVVSVLTERDPCFELSKEKRFAATIHGKILDHSPVIRKGLAEGLALLATSSEALINCSEGKPGATATLAVREMLGHADWVLWGSLNELLPILAEAAPDEFLHAVENALAMESCPFYELFSQEGVGLTSVNHMSGLLWALESLAWDEKYLVRVCVILGELASHDPGGMWANRPADSLSKILMPWLPQTVAPVEKRKVAVQTLCKEWPHVTWNLILNLLPNQVQTSTGTRKPTWRNTIPEGWKGTVSYSEYWDQVSFYAELVLSMADHDTAMLAKLIDHLDNMPRSFFDRLLDVLSADSISRLSEYDRLPLWDKLMKFISTHRRFSDEEWALTGELLSSIETVANKLAPSNPLNLYQRLFTGHNADLYEDRDNWEEQDKELDQQRQEAVGEILEQDGIDGIMTFAEAVEAPDQVGQSLGKVADEEIDKILLPSYLGVDNRKIADFISGYVWSRHRVNGWSWADELDKEEWSDQQMGKFLSHLPFTTETWARAAEWLKNSQGNYWRIANVNSYQASDYGIAVDNLIAHGRPRIAISCLAKMHRDKRPINTGQCTKALLATVTSSEPSYSTDVYHIVELIEALQENPDAAPDDLFRVEWAYLPLLDGHKRVRPKALESRLATDPDFFCDVMRSVYRSKNDSSTAEPSEGKKAIARNALQLLHRWRTPPGAQEDGNFNGAQFAKWLHCVKDLCMKSGHLEVALIAIGEVLIHTPADTDGLWIHHAVASALNARDNDCLRRGFRTGTYNSRGVHFVDPTGRPERELAKKYRQRAEATENAGYHRLAVTLRELADSYDQDAQRIVTEHESDSCDNDIEDS